MVTPRDDSQGFWLGDYADEGDSSQTKGHGRETNLMEEKLNSVLVPLDLWHKNVCLLTMRSELITEVKKNDIEANYSRLQMEFGIAFLFLSYHFLIMDLSA